MKKADDDKAKADAAADLQDQIDIAADAKKADAKKDADDKQALDDQQPSPEPEPEMTKMVFNRVFDRVAPTRGEEKALMDGDGNKDNLKSLAYCWSKNFSTFYMTLKNSNGRVDAEEVKEEVRAESFRLWSLQLVRTQTENTIASVSPRNASFLS